MQFTNTRPELGASTDGLQKLTRDLDVTSCAVSIIDAVSYLRTAQSFKTKKQETREIFELILQILDSNGAPTNEYFVKRVNGAQMINGEMGTTPTNLWDLLKLISVQCQDNMMETLPGSHYGTKALYYPNMRGVRLNCLLACTSLYSNNVGTYNVYTSFLFDVNTKASGAELANNMPADRMTAYKRASEYLAKMRAEGMGQGQQGANTWGQTQSKQYTPVGNYTGGYAQPQQALQAAPAYAPAPAQQQLNKGVPSQIAGVPIRRASDIQAAQQNYSQSSQNANAGAENLPF